LGDFELIGKRKRGEKKRGKMVSGEDGEDD
jgi:hypothetical protein